MYMQPLRIPTCNSNAQHEPLPLLTKHRSTAGVHEQTQKDGHADAAMHLCIDAGCVFSWSHLIRELAALQLQSRAVSVHLQV